MALQISLSNVARREIAVLAFNQCDGGMAKRWSGPNLGEIPVV